MTRGVKFASLILMLLAASVYGFSRVEKPLTTTQNLVRGVGGPVSSNNSWSGYTVFGVIPGSALFPVTSSTAVFSYGFTAGTAADITNMVLYTTAHGSSTITAVTPVTYGGIANPSISLTNASICPVAPTASTPCIVKFDPVTITLSPGNDYYLAVYFTSDSNNGSLGGSQPSLTQSSLWGWYTGGNSTSLIVGNSLPIGNHNSPIFLMYVTNN